MSTWPREVINASCEGHIPHRITRHGNDNEELGDSFFQTKAFQLVSMSAKAITPLMLSAEKTTYPGPSTHSWPTAIVSDSDYSGLSSRLIWQPLLRWQGDMKESNENNTPVWYLHPYRNRSFTSGSFSAAAIAHMPKSIPIPSYTPTNDEVSFVASQYPDHEQSQPPWELIRGELLLMGIAADGLADLTSQAIIHILREKCRQLLAAEGFQSTPDACEILFLSANPTDTNQLRLDAEVRSITMKLRSSDYRDNLKLSTRWAVTPDDLLQALNEHSPRILHFSGHGSCASEILLAGDDGIAKPVGSAALQSLVKTLKGRIKLVVLNCCFSREQAKAITTHIDCAIGMNDSISDDAAVIFAASLYRAIAFGKSIRDAFDQAITSLLLESTEEDATPSLLCRDGVNPEEIYILSESAE